MSKLNLDTRLIQQARELSRNISLNIYQKIYPYSTTSTERAICRLLGVDGITGGVPYPNALVDFLQQSNLLDHGVATIIATVVKYSGLSPQEGTQRLLDQGELPFSLL